MRSHFPGEAAGASLKLRVGKIIGLRQSRHFSGEAAGGYSENRTDCGTETASNGDREARDPRDTCLPIRSRPHLNASYEMTREQVAELYGVAVDEIGRIIRCPR
jgi:hypothetical protein